MPNLITDARQLPTWSAWLAEYANAINYSVRHIQRLILNEPRKKTVKACGWSAADHNHLIRVATLAYDLAAIEASADTVALVQEVKETFGALDPDIWEQPFEFEKRTVPRRRARKLS